MAKQGVWNDSAGFVDSLHWLCLVYLEIESPERTTSVRPRMWEAYVQLRRDHGMPVLPIGIFLRVGLDGIGIETYEERFWELDTVTFKFLYVGLPKLDALTYASPGQVLHK